MRNAPRASASPQCSFDSSSAAVFDAPPASLPPPLPPDAELTQLTFTRVLASGDGFDPRYTDKANALAVCTDIAETPCAVTPSTDGGWLLFDLGAQFTGLYSARLWLNPPHPPTPPSAPPTPPPSASPTNPPPPPPSPSPTPPPPSSPPPDCTSAGNVDSCTVGSIVYTNDGHCDDGGPGSVTSVCAFGSDFSDCGSRLCARRLSEDGVNAAGGHLEIWVSRSRTLFGTRAAVVDGAQRETAVRLTEGDDPSEGRYVYVRSWSAEGLVIDGLKVFALPTARRLQASEPPRPVDVVVDTMRNETRRYCDAQHNDTARLPGLRLSAAMLWTKLDEEQSAVACTDCLTRRPMNCSEWFLWHQPETAAQTEARLRASVRKQLDETKVEREEAIRDALGRSCCRTNKRTGERQCDRQFCEQAFLHSADLRKAHMLRRMHERPGKTVLSVPELVATDMVAPHLHHEKGKCDSEGARKHNELECVAASLAKHLGDKHGFDVDEKLGKFGTSLAGLLTSHLKTTVEGKSMASDPVRAAEAVAARADGRRKLKKKQQKRAIGHRAGWMQAEGRRLAEERPTLVAVGATGQASLLSARQWADNTSRATKALFKTANHRAASMGAAPLSTTDVAHAAWSASLTSKNSLWTVFFALPFFHPFPIQVLYCEFLYLVSWQSPNVGLVCGRRAFFCFLYKEYQNPYMYSNVLVCRKCSPSHLPDTPSPRGPPPTSADATRARQGHFALSRPPPPPPV